MKKIGIKQVAAEAGVSVATVSYVLNNSGRVAEDTRKRVLDAARRLGFVRDNAAVRLRTGQSKLIGVILNNIVNPFFSELVAGLELAAYQDGFLTIISTAQNDMERQDKLLNAMVSQGVGAIILSPVHDTTAAGLDVARSRGIPVISCVRNVPNSDVSFVGVDDEQAGYLAARALIDAGHHTVNFIGGYDHTSTWLGRRDGIRRAMRDAGLADAGIRLFPGPLTPEFAADTVAELIGEAQAGFLSFNDDMAVGVYAALRSQGRSVGRDAAVVSFDNVRIATSLQPALTTVDIFPRDIGKSSAELAMKLIRNPAQAPSQLILNPFRVDRQSVQS